MQQSLFYILKKQFAIVGFFVFCFLSFSTEVIAITYPDAPPSSLLKKEQIIGDWEQVKLTSEVKISKKEIMWDDTQNGIKTSYLIFKFENLTATRILLRWDFNLEYDGTAQESDTESNLILNPNQVYVSDVHKESDSDKVIFVKLYDHQSANLTDCSMSSFQVYPL